MKNDERRFKDVKTTHGSDGAIVEEIKDLVPYGLIVPPSIFKNCKRIVVSAQYLTPEAKNPPWMDIMWFPLTDEQRELIKKSCPAALYISLEACTWDHNNENNF